jgi:hypothetical protein
MSVAESRWPEACDDVLSGGPWRANWEQQPVVAVLESV